MIKHAHGQYYETVKQKVIFNAIELKWYACFLWRHTAYMY